MESNLFEASVYSNRRKRLARSVNSGIILLLGNEESPMNFADNCYPFRQDSSFLYFIGLDLPGLAAIINCETGEEMLFGPEQGIDDIIWMGVHPTLNELARLVNIDKTGSFETLHSVLGKSLLQRTIHILPPYRAQNRIRLSALLNTSLPSVNNFISVQLIKAVVELREVKEECEIEQIEKAGKYQC
jgi:Xaa-Pro aminopeptidase